MESKHFNKSLLLLPRYFKKIAVVVIALSAIIIIINGVFRAGVTDAQKNLLSIFSYDFFITGLLLIAISKDKIEDELTMHLRLKSMAFCFILIVTSVIITPLIQIFFKERVNDSAREIAFQMLITHLLVYYLQKIAR